MECRISVYIPTLCERTKRGRCKTCSEFGMYLEVDVAIAVEFWDFFFGENVAIALTPAFVRHSLDFFYVQKNPNDSQETRTGRIPLGRLCERVPIRMGRNRRRRATRRTSRACNADVRRGGCGTERRDSGFGKELVEWDPASEWMRPRVSQCGWRMFSAYPHPSPDIQVLFSLFSMTFGKHKKRPYYQGVVLSLIWQMS